MTKRPALWIIFFAVLVNSISFTQIASSDILLADDFDESTLDLSKWELVGDVTLKEGYIQIGSNSKIRSKESFNMIELEFSMKVPLGNSDNRMSAAGLRDSTDANNAIFFDWIYQSDRIEIGTKRKGVWYHAGSFECDNITEWQRYKIKRSPGLVQFYQNDKALYARMSEPPFGHLEIEFACIGSYKFYITDITVAGEPIKVEESSSQEPQKEITEQTPSSPTQQEESIIQTTSEKTIFDYLSTADILYIGLGISIVLVVFYRFYFKDDPIEAKSVQLPKKPESTHLPINYDNEEILLSLERGWHAIRHGEKYEWSKSAFRFDLARKTILTNKRILFLKNEKIDSIINLSDINEIYPDVQATGNPYIRIQFKDGTGASIFFILLGLQMYLGIWYMAGKQKALTDRWINAIKKIIEA